MEAFFGSRALWRPGTYLIPLCKKQMCLSAAHELDMGIDLFVQVTTYSAWRRKLSDSASDLEGMFTGHTYHKLGLLWAIPSALSPHADSVEQARVTGGHVFSDAPVLLPSHESNLPTTVTGSGLQNISATVPYPSTTVATPPTCVAVPPTTIAAPPTMVTAPPTTVLAPLTTMEDEEALSLVANDKSIKTISMESLHSSSDGEEGEGDKFKVELVTKGGLQAFQLDDAADAVRADSKHGPQVSVAAVRELWLKRSSTCYCCTVVHTLPMTVSKSQQ